jgi:hypothetical protein
VIGTIAAVIGCVLLAFLGGFVAAAIAHAL